MHRRLLGPAAVIFLIVCPAIAGATNGYFPHGWGTASKGMGGVGAALAFDALAPATNPAGIAFLSDRVDFGVSGFNPNREYTVTGNPSGKSGVVGRKYIIEPHASVIGLTPGTVASENKYFPMLLAGLRTHVGENNAIGVAVYGNNGINTHYHAQTYGTNPAGLDLSQMFLAPTYAHLVGTHSVGVSAILAYQRAMTQGLQAFASNSSAAGKLTDLDHENSYGYGVRVGYMGRITPVFSIGGSYQTHVQMSAFKKYKGFFAEGGDFDIPSNWVAGVSVKPVDRVDLGVDVQRVLYSEVKALANPFLPNLENGSLGDVSGPGFGWKDITVYKAGMQWRAPHQWMVRGGYSYATQPVPTTELLQGILMPDVTQHHATLGLGKGFASGMELNVAAMHAFSKTLTGPNEMDITNQQSIALKASQWEVEVEVSLPFIRMGRI